MRLNRGIGRTTALTIVGLASAVTLAACGGSSSDESQSPAPSAASDAFPVTIKNAFGETEIKQEPKRVATWGWGSTEAAIAVGVYPIAVAEQNYTVGEQKLLPWVEEAYQEADVEPPTILNDDASGAEVPYDEFIAAKPDVIVAPYSGLTKKQYEQLSEIAPVVAYSDGPWTTPWQDTIKLTAQALGREDKGNEVLSDIDTFFADQAAKHPEFKGKTIAAAWATPTQLSVYTEADPRVAILTELGFTIAPSVEKLDNSKGQFYFDLSYEKADALTSDVLITYHQDQAEADALLKNKKAKNIPAVGRGDVAQLITPPVVSAVSPPTALSITWDKGMPALIDQLSALLK